MYKSVLVVWAATALFYLQARAADEFDGLQCRDNIPKAMVGRQSPNNRVVITEKRHSDIGLKDLGATEISDRLSLIFWRICGKEYAELVNTKKKLVRDVLPVPAHSRLSPLSIDGCQLEGRDVPEAVMAILDNGEAKTSAGYFQEIQLPARLAWKIDETQERFVPLRTEHLTCTLSGANSDVKQ